MSAVASKNLYELLGNDPEQDSDREPEPPVKVVDKTPARTTKRNATGEPPAHKAGTGPSSRRGGLSGNEGAFRDRTAGSANNRSKNIDDAGAPRSRGTRGGRGATRRVGRDDRHSKTATVDTEKQTAQGWGAVEGSAELADEKAGEDIAKEDRAEANGEEALELEEPKDNSVSYADYLVQQAEKKLSLAAGLPSVRKANEGSKDDKKWANAKALEHDETEDFIAGSGGKAKRERERKQKQVVEIDHGFVEQPNRESRGGRGGRGRGEGGRGGRGRGEAGRGGPRGGRGGPSSGPKGPALNTSDKSAFPSLGA